MSASADHLAGIEDIFRIENRLDPSHELFFFCAQRLCQIGALCIADPVFAADFSAERICFRIKIVKNVFEFDLPCVIVQTIPQDIDVQIAVTGMSEGTDPDVMFLL